MIDKLIPVSCNLPIKWEHKIINGDMYYVQGIIPNGTVLFSKLLTKEDFNKLFSLN